MSDIRADSKGFNQFVVKAVNVDNLVTSAVRQFETAAIEAVGAADREALRAAASELLARFDEVTTLGPLLANVTRNLGVNGKRMTEAFETDVLPIVSSAAELLSGASDGGGVDDPEALAQRINRLWRGASNALDGVVRTGQRTIRQIEGVNQQIAAVFDKGL